MTKIFSVNGALPVCKNMHAFTLTNGDKDTFPQRKLMHAFTLAEVLITLGIIGVVAAMTMPALMNSTNGAQYKTAYKKALSVLNQAVVLNVALDDFDLSQTSKNSDLTNLDETTLISIFKNRMNVVKVGTQTEYEVVLLDNGTTDEGDDAKPNASTTFGNTNNYTLYFNDGIAFTFPKSGSDKTRASQCTEKEPCYGLIDVNGQKKPNKEIKCDSGQTTTYDSNDNSACDVNNPTDIYPVKMYDQTVVPTSNAAKAVLYGK